MRTIEAVIEQFGGVARAKSLESANIGWPELRLALADGRLQRIARGVYATANAPVTLRAIRSLPAEPACVTAAGMLGMWVLKSPAEPHICFPHSRTYPGYVGHRFRGQPGATDVVVQCLRCLPMLDALVVTESAVVNKLVRLADLRRQLHQRYDSRARAVVEMVTPQSQSIIECVARYLLRTAGHVVDSQVKVMGVGHVDLMVDGVLAVETDGAEFHLGKDQFIEDRRRWNVSLKNGVPTLVVTYDVVVNHPREFLQLVHETLSMLNGGGLPWT